MIISQLNGGLGNQLFQYAAGLALAERHHAKLLVDSTQIKRDRLRRPELSNFILPLQEATTDQIGQLRPIGLTSRIIQRVLPLSKRTCFKESGFSYDRRFSHCGDNTYLQGYFQSPLYLEGHEELIRNTFRLKEYFTSGLSVASNIMSGHESVSLHIRRGDYTDPEIRRIHGMLSLEYYQAAMHLARQDLGNPRFYIFSDDLPWAAEHLSSPDTFLMDERMSGTAMSDFYLMGQCRHHIIANSSFSWWAAWLQDEPAKKVYAPGKWFAGRATIIDERYPDHWIRVNADPIFQ